MLSQVVILPLVLYRIPPSFVLCNILVQLVQLVHVVGLLVQAQRNIVMTVQALVLTES